MQHKPTAKIELSDQFGYVLLLHDSNLAHDDHDSQLRQREYSYAVQNGQGRHEWQQYEPKPENYKYFLIDNIEREYTDIVEVLDRAAGAVSVEHTLGDFGEVLVDRTDLAGSGPVQLLREQGDGRPIRAERAAQEQIQQVNLAELEQCALTYLYISYCQYHFILLLLNLTP